MFCAILEVKVKSGRPTFVLSAVITLNVERTETTGLPHVTVTSTPARLCCSPQPP